VEGKGVFLGNAEGGENFGIGGHGDKEEGHVVEAADRETIRDLHYVGGGGMLGRLVPEGGVEDEDAVEEEEEEALNR